MYSNNIPKKSPMLKLGMTPLTSALYSETPSRTLDNPIQTLHSRRILNMDETETYNTEAIKKLK